MSRRVSRCSMKPTETQLLEKLTPRRACSRARPSRTARSAGRCDRDHRGGRPDIARCDPRGDPASATRSRLGRARGPHRRRDRPSCRRRSASAPTRRSTSVEARSSRRRCIPLSEWPDVAAILCARLERRSGPGRHVSPIRAGCAGAERRFDPTVDLSAPTRTSRARRIVTSAIRKRIRLWPTA